MFHYSEDGLSIIFHPSSCTKPCSFLSLKHLFFHIKQTVFPLTSKVRIWALWTTDTIRKSPSPHPSVAFQPISLQWGKILSIYLFFYFCFRFCFSFSSLTKIRSFLVFGRSEFIISYLYHAKSCQFLSLTHLFFHIKTYIAFDEFDPYL